MLEQEIASIIKFMLDKSGNPTPYYYSIPEDFSIPAAYFPTPEIGTGGETLGAYRMEYDWYIKFFHETAEEAHALGLVALTAIKEARNLIPLIDMDGNPMGRGIRVNDPKLKKIDAGTAQLTITFTSRRLYAGVQSEKMQSYHIGQWESPGLYESRIIDAAMAEALSKYIKE